MIHELPDEGADTWRHGDLLFGNSFLVFNRPSRMDHSFLTLSWSCPTVFAILSAKMLRLGGFHFISFDFVRSSFFTWAVINFALGLNAK